MSFAQSNLCVIIVSEHYTYVVFQWYSIHVASIYWYMNERIFK